MFETNIDIDFDDESLGDLKMTSAVLPRISSVKRVNENTNPLTETTKRLRLTTDVKTPKLSDNIKIVLEKFSKGNSDTVIKSPIKRVVKRTFPGPAGFLPERMDLTVDIKALEKLYMRKRPPNEEPDILCSQASMVAFSSKPWLQMAQDFSPGSSEDIFLPGKYNIEWIKSRAAAKKLISQKAPFLAAVIQSVECSNARKPTVMISLKDATGEIQGTVLHDLYKEYADDMTIGSVVILTQFGVLSTGFDKHYITVTSNNLVTIYHQRLHANEAEKENITTFKRYHGANNFSQRDNELKVVRVQYLRMKDISSVINKMRNRQKLGVANHYRRSEQAKTGSDVVNTASHAGRSVPSCSKNPEIFEVPSNFFDNGDDMLLDFKASQSTLVKTCSAVEIDEITHTNKNNCINEADTAFNDAGQVKISKSSKLSKFKFQPRPQTTNTENQGCGSTQTQIANNCASKSTSNRSFEFLSQENNSCSQISVKNQSANDTDILQNAFEGMDADSLFGDMCWDL